MKAEEYVRHDGLGLADLIRRKQVSRSEVVEAAVDVAQRCNPAINAICYEAFDHAREQAAARDRNKAGQGMFDGVPFLLKELGGELQGWPERRGCRALADNVSRGSTALVERQLSTGLIPIGKTTTPEFGLIAVTESDLYGDTRNPWHPEHTPGGSSGGSAAAVAAGIVPLAHANDGGGSIRIPASCCGLVGMKPSRGRMPQAPAGEMGLGLGYEHVVSRSVRDSAALLDLTHGDYDGPPYGAPSPETSYLQAVDTPPGKLRIAYWTRYWGYDAETHPECVAAVEGAVSLLSELGHEVAEERPRFDYAQIQRSFMKLWTSMAAHTVDGITPNPDLRGFEQQTLDLVELGRKVSAVELMSAREELLGLGRLYGEFHQSFDLMLTTTLGTPPLKIGEWRRDTLYAGDGVQTKFLLCSGLANATGQPAISLPLHMTAEGLPVGVMLTAAYGREDLLYQVAGQLERAVGWSALQPAIWG